MALKTFRPTSPGRRQLVIVDRSDLYKGKPVKKLTQGLTKSGGRNNAGRVTAFRHAGGHKRTYRIIDFKRRKWDVPATIERLEYDPNRTAWIALLKYADGELAYIIAPQRVKVGDAVIAAEKADVKPGNAMPLRSIPVGTIIHCIEIKPLKGAQMVRSAGSYAQLVGRDAGYAQLRLTSGEVRMVPDGCMATIGAVSNPDNMNEVWGKAGRSLWLGRKPSVRGVAMNPVDHPHGGGEGKTSGARHPTTPWGKKTRGPKTRKTQASDRLIIRRRHAKK
ncbi:MAG: large subunit ribosomal protein L2 [Alphaproteobacteria bacterium]|nr:MAG: large subunit ribosomal protein L2 [Alphaproteobacteria bacterium]